MTLVGRLILALLMLNFAACSTLQTVSIESAMQYSPPRGVDYGSLVVIKTLDKRTARFRVTEIRDEGLGGEPGFFRYEEMDSLKVDRSEQKQVAWGTIIGAVLGIAALVFLIDNSDSVRVCSGTPCPQPNP